MFTILPRGQSPPVQSLLDDLGASPHHRWPASPSSRPIRIKKLQLVTVLPNMAASITMQRAASTRHTQHLYPGPYSAQHLNFV